MTCAENKTKPPPLPRSRGLARDAALRPVDVRAAVRAAAKGVNTATDRFQVDPDGALWERPELRCVRCDEDGGA